MRDDLKRVKQKLSLTFAIAIIGTCVVFGLLYYLGIDLLSYYIEAGSCMIYYNEKPYIDEFQQYVSDNDISTTDVEQYDEWMSEHDVAFYSVQEMGKVIYNKSNVDKLISPAKNMYDYRFTGSYELPVQFSDIEAEVFIYTGFTEKYYIAFMIFDVGFSLMLGIVFVYLRIRKIIAGYQTELEASQEQEKKARQEKDELMRNMAHDLRTPLTGVMTYVDVMKLENEAYAENMKNLNFISEKVLDIRTQVDNLLDFSIAGSQRPVELDASMDVEYIFGDYLSDVCAQLMKSNYEVDAEGISFKQVKVAVNMAFLTRIFSNLTDNIYKYADNKKPVVMKTAFTKKTFSVEIGNGVCDNKNAS
ncbi:sensor histidine kinase [Agathobacter rectalis]|uniref:sensor histidine kinase n=1 Tax=Agathobacter rectalis TaxID=39491 RepID=UPI0006D84729|nr:HAMP domain-containing sensor histidine kinase [Agathobacter rectalis]